MAAKSICVKFAEAMANECHVFDRYLKPGETILWIGRPRTGFYLRDADIILIPVSIIFIGFASILTFAAIHYHSPWPYKVFAGLTVLMALYLAFIRHIRDYRRRQHMWYCITTQRVLQLRGHKLSTLPIENIEYLDKTEEKDGSGFIFFGKINPLWPWLFGKFYFTSHPLPGFESIADVSTVFDLLQEVVHTQSAQ